ncbi:pentatricopeptide repeat-containing protein At3g12770 [Cryptomeria japonica]|uniref:pentatricopeptide repeat-containing protein At3g12770 n=1 Tax=Cryptomeria japonica TaxID=3369 RepID=UPI0027DAB465|nr:pentatricopeptide repeat-containing protein At3g12770 [Cryptomeria japonica]
MPTFHLRCNKSLHSLFKYRTIHMNSSLYRSLNSPSTPAFYKLQHSNIEDYYYSALHRCKTIKQLLGIHAQVNKIGVNQRISVAIKLVNKYAEYRNVENARLVFDRMSGNNACQVFEKMSEHNILLWNAMLAGYASHGLSEETITLYYQMQIEGMSPDEFTFSIVLKVCASPLVLQEGKKIHSHIVKKMGLESGVVVATGLVDMYVKCGSIEDAQQVFDKMPERNVVSWTAMLRGYVQNGQGIEALKMFNQMQLGEEIPNSFTTVNVLAACGQLGYLHQGKWIHAYVIRSGFESDCFIGPALINMYANCNSIFDGCQMFDKISKRDVFSWTSIIGACAQNGYAHEALANFKDMQLQSINPNSVTLLSVIMACTNIGNLTYGRCVHGYVLRRGFQADESVGNSVLTMYAKCHTIEVASTLFQKMARRNVVSWNAMITGYTQIGYHNDALTIFHQMVELENMKPDQVTVVSALSSCSHLGALQKGKWIHEYIIRSGFAIDVFIGAALIDMYAKCGSIDIAHQVFQKMCKKNVVVWSALIAGYGMHGHGHSALALFAEMKQLGTKPNHATFISILSACSHAGLVEEGWYCFHSMQQDYCIAPMMKHYACMVDLLGRAGHLDEAQDFIKRMPLEPDSSIWGALLAACKIHSNIVLGQHVAGHLLNLNPEDPGYYVLLSNIYAAAGKWENVERVRSLMKDSGLKKTPGCSVIEVKNNIHSFLTGDRSHPQSKKIYATLQSLAGQMEDLGYVPDTNVVLHDVDEEMKEHLLLYHSEKLAIAFGLISTCAGASIQIRKNLRVCSDCHTATKFISRIVRREIIVRDANRFHHFKDGLCSCGDYW